MELQSFVDNNHDYVDKFKENNLYTRKYSLLDLVLVKAKKMLIMIMKVIHG